MEDSVNLLSLWPDFGALYDMIVGSGSLAKFSSKAFSAAIVSLLLFTFLIFAAYVFFAGLIPASRRIRALNGLVGDLNKDNLVSQRRTLIEKAGELGYVGDLWLEFDETFVLSGEPQKIYNTIDSNHFFNSKTLAGNLTENRLLAAVPGFLTAIGVLGTFAGLQMGLVGIDLSDATKQQEGIQHVIASAAIAFMTSVWGVSTSVIFNFFEKLAEQHVKSGISRLQDRIDFLFPRVSPEQALVHIDQSTRKSEDALNGLAERIGEQLQQAVSGMGEQVTAGIERVMKPAMDSLVNASSELADRQAAGATDALSQLVGQFLERISEAGEGQKRLMQEATEGLNSSISGWQSQMSEFITKLEHQGSESVEAERKLKSDLFEELQKFSGGLSATVGEQARTSQESLERSQAITGELGKLTEQLASVMGSLDSYSQRMADASTNMEQAGSKVRSATMVLENEIGKAIGAVKDLSQENSTMVQNTATLVGELSNLQTQLRDASNSIAEAASSAATTFDAFGQRQEQFTASLRETMSSYETSMEQKFSQLTEQASNFLTDYSERVETQTNSRLDAWNKQTENFSEQMLTTVRAIQSVVADIEDVTGR